MSRPIYVVNRVCRATRRVLDTHAEGVEQSEAREIAALLRADDEANEALWGYEVSTLPIAQQAEALGIIPEGAAAEITAEASAEAITTPRHRRVVGADRSPKRTAADRAATLVETVLAMPSRYAPLVAVLADDRARDGERDHNLRVALRQWAKEALGSVDALAVEVARRYGCTAVHARNVLYADKGADVLDVAVEVFREKVAGEHAAGAVAEAVAA